MTNLSAWCLILHRFCPGQTNKNEWKLKIPLGIKDKKDKEGRKKVVNQGIFALVGIALKAGTYHETSS